MDEALGPAAVDETVMTSTVVALGTGEQGCTRSGCTPSNGCGRRPSHLGMEGALLATDVESFLLPTEMKENRSASSSQQRLRVSSFLRR